MKNSISYLVIAFICFCIAAQAQQNDSLRLQYKQDSIQSKRAVRKAIYGDARKATIMSAVFPGLGQIYNRKYWKAPVIYAALGGLGYWGVNNHIQYKYFSNNLRYEYDDDPGTVNLTGYNSAQLIEQKKYHQKYRDIAVMLGILVYLVNVIDANVDAHLKTFDVSDDLSLQLNPYSNFDNNNKLQAGLTLKLKFK
ncbi:MAG: hypothetical protein K0S53_1746 [Bacteroidetes bacterium]|nr:hypothetical protein [Bacteroidota bacterium]MDF2450842.1 hypothetical protein [Bacteroidota bacterium]